MARMASTSPDAGCFPDLCLKLPMMSITMYLASRPGPGRRWMRNCRCSIATVKAVPRPHRRPDNDIQSVRTDLISLVAAAQQRARATIHWRPGWLHASTHVAWHWHGIDLDLGELFTPGSAHICPVRHELCLVLLEFGILNKTLVLANATLLEATEKEDGKTKADNTANGGDNGNLGSGRQAAPALRG